MSIVQNSASMTEETSRYHTKIGLLDNSTHYGRVAKMVGHGKQVLELGCSTGYFSGALSKQFGCTVTGVELDANAAREAEKYCREVIQADLDQTGVLQAFPDAIFDVIVCSDVLEHLRNPNQLLVDLKRVLKPDGYIVASIPHVGHGSIRLSLLAGQFPYRRMGLLDDTHLRFFDRMELQQLFVKAGYDLFEVNRNRWSIFDNEIGSRVGAYPADVVSAINSDPEADTYQFIVKAKVNNGTKTSAVSNKTSVDFVIFQTPGQPLNDKVYAYLDGLDLSKVAPKFHLVGSSDTDPQSVASIPIEQFEFGNHDFRTFRFVSCGGADLLDRQGNSTQPSLPINKGAVLNKLLPQLQGEFVFITDAQSLPTTDCLSCLIDYARGDEKCAVAVASPEIFGVGMPYCLNGGSISWAPFTCVLLRRSHWDKVGGVDVALVSPAQEVDFCWRLRQAGLTTAQVDKARFFTFGISSWNDHVLKLKQLHDAAKLILVWGSLRVFAGFLKNAVLADPDLSSDEKSSLVCQMLFMAPQLLAQRKSVTEAGVVGFYGPGHRYCGISPN